jgi:hypothetical protein
MRCTRLERTKSIIFLLIKYDEVTQKGECSNAKELSYRGRYAQWISTGKNSGQIAVLTTIEMIMNPLSPAEIKKQLFSSLHLKTVTMN